MVNIQAIIINWYFIVIDCNNDEIMNEFSLSLMDQITHFQMILMEWKWKYNFRFGIPGIELQMDKFMTELE